MRFFDTFNTGFTLFLTLCAVFGGGAKIYTDIDSTQKMTLAQMDSMKDVIKSNTSAIQHFEESVTNIPKKIMLEHDLSVIFSALNYPAPMDRGDIEAELDGWFANTHASRIASLSFACRHGKKELAAVIYEENVKKFCGRFITWAVIKQMTETDNQFSFSGRENLPWAG